MTSALPAFAIAAATSAAWAARSVPSVPSKIRLYANRRASSAAGHAGARVTLPSAPAPLLGRPRLCSPVVNGRVINFSAGPATLPLAVLQEVQRDLLSIPGVGASALEVSHRSAWFTGVIEEAEANLRALLRIPQTHRVIFCQGGATQQFSMTSLNFLARRNLRGLRGDGHLGCRGP